MNYLTEAPRIIFGTGMLSHQLLASIIPGTALCLLIFAIKSKENTSNKYYRLFRLILSLFIVQFAIALISGLSLETGLSYFWPSLKGSLLYLVHYPLGRSALIAFFVVGGISYYLLKINKEDQLQLRVFACFLIFIASFFLSLWSMVINCLMQDPSALTFENIESTIVITSIDFKSIFSNNYIKYRLIHTYQSSFLQGI